MIPAADQWGPFALDLRPGERMARLRCLRAVVHLTCGPRGDDLSDKLRRAEVSTVGPVVVLAALNALDPLDRRRVLASYAAINRPV
ncbi:hypothetical protein [Methylorubrum suomiense]|uniref:Uncharacterized protein n=1 Tax=Methylorubrum suomiense TaxID=144191 RepID=A0ABQ4UY13_9HYPH|nr:hypothetical protein [Methylorubrum suomiense]GJE77236.1 hypothetical protein BGCPKDLD_3839 [Methylorubrum suomiense]